MASRIPKCYYEPWSATKSSLWDSPYRFGPPKWGATPEELSEAIDAWQASKHKAEKDADWVIWGSKIAVPGLCKNIDGSVTVATDQAILAFSKKPIPKGGVDHEAIAKRVVACVNACAGINDPESLIKDVRALMLAYLQGDCEDPRQDPRVGSILGRCIPIEELES
jgi:hypothetical protein